MALGPPRSCISSCRTRIDDIKPGTSGKPVPGYSVKVVGDDGNTLPAGEVGTLWVKGESNALCYWNNPEKTRSTMVGEWLNTGDMYYVDSEGYYVNAGRGDDMLKVSGMWCSPIEIVFSVNVLLPLLMYSSLWPVRPYF